MINHKKLFRLYREEKLAVRRRGGRKRAIGTRAPMMVPMAPNDRWSLDFVSDQLTDGRRFRILTVDDDCIRMSPLRWKRWASACFSMSARRSSAAMTESIWPVLTILTFTGSMI